MAVLSTLQSGLVPLGALFAWPWRCFLFPFWRAKQNSFYRSSRETWNYLWLAAWGITVSQSSVVVWSCASKLEFIPLIAQLFHGSLFLRLVWAENKYPHKLPSLKPLNPSDSLSWLKWGLSQVWSNKTTERMLYFSMSVSFISILISPLLLCWNFFFQK